MHKEKLAVILALAAIVMAWPFRLPISLQPIVELSLPGVGHVLSEGQNHEIQHVKRDAEKDAHHGVILSKLIEIRAETDTTTDTTSATTDTATTATSTSDTATTTSDTTATSTTTSETSSTTASTASSTTATTTSSTSTSASSTTTASTSSSTATTTSSSTSSTTSSTSSCAPSATSSSCVALRKFNHDGIVRAIAVFCSLAGVGLIFILWRYIKRRKEQNRQKQNRISQNSDNSTASTEFLTGEGRVMSPADKQRYRESLMFMDQRSSTAFDSRRNSRNILVVSPLAKEESTDPANTDIALEPMRPAHI
ncbi:hypothetical protein DTO166G4_99 [Paecilomyces variotii]|nr:hypothetical protein DTO166G4_99 [Paecilomyces variotii]KAJ9239806.1 hypothetical protein DTO166G5_2073 [Paecilomyces variotii]